MAPVPGAGGEWMVERLRGSAGELHSRPLEVGSRPLWSWLEVTGPAVVLGGGQDGDVIERERAERAGVEICRRRGGGTLVWLDRDSIWFDVSISSSDPRWETDVGRAFLWLGEFLAGAMGSLGVSADVRTGGLRSGPWSDLLCFGGLGPGELTVGGRKLVGLSQRRTRAGARFQGVVYPRWRPDALRGLVDPRSWGGRGIRAADLALGLEDLGLTADDFRRAVDDRLGS